MKKIILTLSLVIILLFVIFSCCGCNKMPYSLKSGAYGFKTATITNRRTNEIVIKDSNDIINNSDDFKQWGNLLNFQIAINKDTEYFCNNDKYFVIYENLAFEIVDDNMLRLHFPYWRGYDYILYDIVIILETQVMYC